MYSNYRWLPLVPLLSLAILVACSGDDDNNKDNTTPLPSVVVGDDNGNGIADSFESASAEDDANGNNIADVYEAPADTATAAADTNANGIDDSFEASLTGGADANADGVDDAAAAAVAGEQTVGGGPCGSAQACELLAQIEDQETVWVNSSLDSYVYQYNAFTSGDAGPDCPILGLSSPSFITVQNGSIVNVTIDGVEETSDTGFRTIDQHFAFMRDNVDRLLPTATYSQALGYPLTFRIANPIEGCPGQGSSYSINVCGDDFDCEF